MASRNEAPVKQFDLKIWLTDFNCRHDHSLKILHNLPSDYLSTFYGVGLSDPFKGDATGWLYS